MFEPPKVVSSIYACVYSMYAGIGTVVSRHMELVASRA